MDKLEGNKKKGLPWGGQIHQGGCVIKLVNTCPVDNLLYMIHVLLQQKPFVRDWFINQATNTELNVCEVLLSISKCFEEGN